MTWDQIKEVEQKNLHYRHHLTSHEYLIDKIIRFIIDIEKANKYF